VAGRTRSTAVFAAGDEVALGALDAARAAGTSVPEELAIVAFDDIPSASCGARLAGAVSD